MHVSSSSPSGASALWGPLASRLASARASDTATAAGTAEEGGTAADTPASDASRPPPPPAGFEEAMSTAQFAAMAAPPGPPPGGDPMAELDADDDGSISAEEFGLEGASDEVQALFEAIDSDGSGALSSEETEAFRQMMMEAEGDAMPPPPPPQANAAVPDVGRFVQALAERYASLAGEASGQAAVSLAA